MSKVDQRISALAKAFVSAPSDERKRMTFAERTCAALAVIASHGGEARVPAGDSSDTLYARIRLDEAEAQAMTDAGWNGVDDWWTL